MLSNSDLKMSNSTEYCIFKTLSCIPDIAFIWCKHCMSVTLTREGINHKSTLHFLAIFNKLKAKTAHVQIIFLLHMSASIQYLHSNSYIMIHRTLLMQLLKWPMDVKEHKIWLCPWWQTCLIRVWQFRGETRLDQVDWTYPVTMCLAQIFVALLLSILFSYFKFMQFVYVRHMCRLGAISNYAQLNKQAKESCL